MIWGTRLISPTGIFARDTAAHPGRKPPNRYIVFMTDGEMSPSSNSYAMYGIDHSRGQLVVLASEPTSSDFNKYCTAKAKADYCSLYDQIVEFRDVGNANNPKVTILCWQLA